MGVGASAPGAFERLPDPVDETAALALLGKCFDRADWETISHGTGKVAKDTFITTIEMRNNAPSLRAWLEFWRIDELLEVLEEMGKLFFNFLFNFFLSLIFNFHKNITCSFFRCHVTDRYYPFG